MTAKVKDDWDTTPDLFEPLQAEVTTPEQWLELAELVQPNDERRLNHALFGDVDLNIMQALHIDFSNPEINGTKYHEPLLLPLCNGKGELKQVAIMELGKRIYIPPPDHKPRAFARFGSFEQSQPIFIAYDLFNALKLADNGFNVALCILGGVLSGEAKNEIAEHECNLIKSVCSQLSKAGYRRLYMVSYSKDHPKLHDALRNAVASYNVRFIDSDLDIVQKNNSEVQTLIDEALQQDGYVRNEKGLNTTTDIQANNSVIEQITQQNNYSLIWGEPEPIKAELLPVQQLARDMLPTDLSEYVFDNAERADHMPNDFVAVSLLTCLGGLIGARVSIKPKQQDDWEIVPNLWGGIVGNPSMKKSPAFNAGSKPLNNLVVKAKAEAKQKQGGVVAMPTDEEREKAKQAIIEKQKIALELASKIKALNATIVKQKTTEEREKAITELAEIKAEQEIIEQMQNHADNEAIPEKRYLTNDTSPEALTDLEINNPNGIIIIRDELIGLLSSLTRNGEDTGRAFYLEGWNGTGSYQYDRIVRGAGYIPNHCITLLGGIQPDKLVAYLEATVQGAGNDGLLQRFQLLVYPDAPTWKYEDRYPNKDARSAVYELFEAIDSLKPSDLVKMGANPADQYNDRPYFRFSESAQELFINWFTELNAEKIANEEHAIIQEHLSKYGKLMPALALIFHIIDGVNFGNVGAVSKASAEMAIQWCEYLEKHARRIYGLVLNSSELRASTLALKLQQLPANHEWLSSEGVTASQILRKNWKHLTTIEGVYDALDVLTDKNWLRLEEVEPSAKGGRPKKRFLINKKIFLAKNT